MVWMLLWPKLSTFSTMLDIINKRIKTTAISIVVFLLIISRFYALTSRASRSAFPISINASTKLIIARPGITAKYAFPRII